VKVVVSLMVVSLIEVLVDSASALIMAIDALACRSTIGSGSGSGWEVDGDSALNWIIAAL
ncbi:hypothetical protein Tco_0518557, partial [Tanacetum coccineum]